MGQLLAEIQYNIHNYDLISVELSENFEWTTYSNKSSSSAMFQKDFPIYYFLSILFCLFVCNLQFH